MDTFFISERNDYIFHHETTDPFEVGVHLHDSYEIYQALSDNIRYFVEGTVYQLKKHDMIITNTKELHRPQVIDTNPYDRRYIQFKPHAFSPFFNEDYTPLELFDNRKLGVGNLLSLDQENTKILLPLVEQIEQYEKEPSPANHLLQKASIVQLLVKLDQLFKQNTSSSSDAHELDTRVKDTLAYINTHFANDINLTDIAEATYMDKYYLSHLFKKCTGFTIFEYIQSKRIQLAKRLIHQGLPITDIATKCGYNDYSNFYKTYKKITGVSPTESKKHTNT